MHWHYHIHSETKLLIFYIMLFRKNRRKSFIFTVILYVVTFIEEQEAYILQITLSIIKRAMVSHSTCGPARFYIR